MEKFYIITTTNRNSTFFLKAGKGKNCVWDDSQEEAIWFNTLTEAEEFAKYYFKEFKNWRISVIDIDMEKEFNDTMNGLKNTLTELIDILKGE